MYINFIYKIYIHAFLNLFRTGDRRNLSKGMELGDEEEIILNPIRT